MPPVPRPQGRSSLTRNLWRRLIGSSVSQAAGYAMGGAIQPVLEPFTQSLANKFWKMNPTKTLGAGTAARASVSGVMGSAAAADEAAQTGVNGERFATLEQLAAEYPPSAMLIEQLRRGIVTEQEARTALRRQGYGEQWVDRILATRDYLVPASDLVRMAVREVFSENQRTELDLDAGFPPAFLERARLLGFSEQVARDYWAAHWELPSFEQGADMFHRGIITEAQFDGLLAALDYAPVWRPRMRQLSERIPPLSDMIRFAVHDAYDDDAVNTFGLDSEFPEQFATDAARHGYSRANALLNWRAHWRQVSVTQAARMFHRGLLTRPQLQRLMKVQDYSPFWRTKLEGILYLTLGRVDLRRMLAAGVIDRDRVLRGYTDLGYHPDDAETLTRFAEIAAEGGSTAKHQTAAELRDEREGGYITDAEFRAGLTLLGYTGDTLEAEVLLADARRSKRWRDKAVDAIGKAYIAGKQDEAAARSLLEQAGVTGEAADHLFFWWRIIDAATEKQLTAAQVRAAYRKNTITRDDALNRLELLDYSLADATIYLDSG